MRGAVALQALVDTGSDETVFPVSLAIAIGVDLDYRRVGVAAGVSGHPIELIPGRITFEMSDDDETYQWQTTVGFMESANAHDEIALLGHSGFLEYFTATFNSEVRELELTANRKMLALQRSI